MQSLEGFVCRAKAWSDTQKSAGDIENVAPITNTISREVERVDSLLPGLRQTGRHLVEWCVGDKTGLRIGR
jgi:hypothetical protein